MSEAEKKELMETAKEINKNLDKLTPMQKQRVLGLVEGIAISNEAMTAANE